MPITKRVENGKLFYRVQVTMNNNTVERRAKSYEQALEVERDLIEYVKTLPKKPSRKPKKLRNVFDRFIYRPVDCRV